MRPRFIVSLILLCFAELAFAQAVEPPHPSRTYLNFCASCHGDLGDGLGKAARFLFPKPRSFINNPIQFATSENRVASADDIKKTILNGVPNSSMTGWKSLTSEQVDILVQDIIELRLFGAKRRYIDLLIRSGEITSPVGSEVLTDPQKDELQSYLLKETEPNSIWKSPILTGFNPSAERGKALYRQQNCHKCHGDDYRGSYGIDLSGEYGFPAFARDLVNEPFKYGDTTEDIMRGLRLGVPGTKMPASTTLSTEQLVDLTAFIKTIHSPKNNKLTNAQRYERAIGNLRKTP